MEAKEFFKEKERMCDSNDYCEDCSLSATNNKTGEDCGNFIIHYREEAIAIVKKWSEEHQKETNRQAFERLFSGRPWTKSRSKNNAYCDCLRGLFYNTPCYGCAWWDEEYTGKK